MRLFVALWPPPEVVVAIGALARPDHPAVRWTAPDQWHVTLRFLGEVAESEVPVLTDSLQAATAALRCRTATLGPVTTRLNRRILSVPVVGVDDLGSAVIDATREIGAPPDARAFSGHVTLGRARGRHPVPAELAGTPVVAAWPVAEVVLVRSHLEPGAPVRYEPIGQFPLAA